MKSKFGFGQFWEHTPIVVKKIRTGLNYFIGASLIYVPAISAWLKVTPETLTNILGIMLLGCNTILQMFGINDNDSSKQSTDLVGGRPDDPRDHPKNG